MEKYVQTQDQFNEVIDTCRTLFEKKNKDYGTAWRILRPASLTDQIYIKAKRIRSVQESGENKVGEPIENEFIGILNYNIMALIQLTLKEDSRTEIPTTELMDLYDTEVKKIIELREKKNHDYGEAWRDMRIPTFCDLILQKLLRVRQIEDNKGHTLSSEGIEANYQDMVNYSVFALIRMKE